MKRLIDYNEEMQEFARIVEDFVARDVAPHYAEWEEAGRVPLEMYRTAGERGIIGIQIDPEYGGSGMDSFRFNSILLEVCAKYCVTLAALPAHMDIVMPYITRFASSEQKQRWLPRMVAGELMTSIAMTEPDTGSDLAGMRTRAVRADGGWVLNGAKTFITGGINAGLVVVVARTSNDSEDRRSGLTLLAVEEGMTGFRRGRTLKKLGMRATDTAELFFEDVFVPDANVVGVEGKAFEYLRSNLVQERLSASVRAVAYSEAAIAVTREYVTMRRVFGKLLSSFQNTKFELADVKSKCIAAQAMVDDAVNLFDAGELTAADAAAVKLFTTDIQGEVVDRCLQLHGGNGYMLETPINRLFADARANRIVAGTNEIMRTIIAKEMDL